LAVIIKKFGTKTALGGGEFQEANERIIDASIMDAPLRSYILGGVPIKVPEAIALLLNGKVIQAVRKLLEKDKT